MADNEKDTTGLGGYIATIPDRFVNMENARALVASTAELAIPDFDDAENVKLVRGHWKGIRDTRLGVEAKRKELKARINPIAQAIDGHARELTAILKPEEDRLKADLDAQKTEMERRKQAILDARMDSLRAVESVLTPDLVGSLSDEAFDELLAEESQRFEAVQAEREAEAERLRIDAKKKADADAKAEADRQAREAEIERKAKEQQDAADKLAAREAKIAEAEAKLEADAAALKAAQEEAAKPKPEPEAAPILDGHDPSKAIGSAVKQDDGSVEVTIVEPEDSGLREPDFGGAKIDRLVRLRGEMAEAIGECIDAYRLVDAMRDKIRVRHTGLAAAFDALPAMNGKEYHAAIGRIHAALVEEFTRPCWVPQELPEGR